MRQRRGFFGVELTDPEQMGWVVEKHPFEIIHNRTRDVTTVERTAWMKSQHLPFQVASLLATIAARAEALDGIQPPYRNPMSRRCDSGPGLQSSHGTATLGDEYYRQVGQISADLNAYFDLLLELVEECLNIPSKSEGAIEGRWTGELYLWLDEFFITAAQYWPDQFCPKLRSILHLPAFLAFADTMRESMSKTPDSVWRYMRAVTTELFKQRFCYASRQDYRPST